MFLVVATLGLLFLGGQVTSHGAGLSVPDWPTSYGRNMFLYPISDWDGGIFHEQLHRVVAATVGLLTTILAVWLALREPREWVRILGFLAFCGVILQGVLGGMTVLFLQPAWLSSAHAVLAQSFFMLTILIAYTQSRERAQREHDPGAARGDPWAGPVLLVVGLVYIQLVLGAFMRHTESGLAIPDFPRMAGQIVPWFTSESVAWVNEWRMDYAFEHGVVLPEVTLAQVWIHFAHRAGALLITLAVILALYRAYAGRIASPRMWRMAVGLAVLIAVQATLGVATVLTQRVPVIASLHLATGAAVLGMSTVFALRALPLSLHAQRSATHEQPAVSAPAQKA